MGAPRPLRLLHSRAHASTPMQNCRRRQCFCVEVGLPGMPANELLRQEGTAATFRALGGLAHGCAKACVRTNLQLLWPVSHFGNTYSANKVLGGHVEWREVQAGWKARVCWDLPCDAVQLASCLPFRARRAEQLAQISHFSVVSESIRVNV